MKTLSQLALAFAASAVAATAFAATPIHPSAEAHAAAGAPRSAKVAKAMADRSQRLLAAQAAAEAGVKSTLPGELVANPYRAYPPSCAADPLPDSPPSTGPKWTTQMDLWTRDQEGNPADPEQVTITIWRLPCSSSGSERPYNVDNGDNAIMLMRIKRSSDSSAVYPTVPYVYSFQTGDTGSYVRLATEPNTVVSEAPYDSPIYFDTTYVLENYPFDNFGYTYFDYDLQLEIDPVFDDACSGCATLGIPGYTADPSEYPSADDDLPINGYMSATWFDPAHSGEGMVVQVIDNGGSSRTFFGAWYTFDDLGIPFWITAQGVVPYGDNVVNATGYYQTGGGFAGDFGSSSDQHTWGTLTFRFPSCSTMVFTYNGSADAVDGGPSGSGTRTWSRLADTNGLTCE